MNTTASISSNYFSVQSSGSSSATTASDDAGSADRFLKLLVTQMQNQDPLNPMDNAEITSQMAQINTVTGLDKLNTTVEGLNAQFVQLQALSGASLVGREVTIAGNRLVAAGGVAEGAFDLGATAGSVKVEVLNAAGRVVSTLDMGAQSAGRHAFKWEAGAQPDGDYSFRINATQGTTAVASTPLMRDRVEAVRTSGSSLTLETASGQLVPWRDVQSFN
jgi:flagellar basal-body rod modification protein FlgD